jgi:hypothetical protein
MNSDAFSTEHSRVMAEDIAADVQNKMMKLTDQAMSLINAMLPPNDKTSVAVLVATQGAQLCGGIVGALLRRYGNAAVSEEDQIQFGLLVARRSDVMHGQSAVTVDSMIELALDDMRRLRGDAS